MCVDADGVSWASEVEVGIDDASTAESVMFDTSTTIIVASTVGSVIHRFLDRGWHAESDASKFVRDSALAAATHGLMVIRLFGAFDDREASADIIGSSEVLKQLEVEDAQR